MNLLHDQWIPVRRRAGQRDWISPPQLSDPDIVAFAADRPDFNGALAQFAIGLLQSTTPADTPAEWRRLLTTPPTEQELSAWFAPVAEAFLFEGEGPRFMQDLTLSADEATLNPVAALFIDSPGENALRNNSDHFVKRGRIDNLCPACAATALFTLQTNAPSGGVGYRTGLRGGGPLTTLLLRQKPQSLWQDLWLNVLEGPLHRAHSGDAEKTALHFRFPWLRPIDQLQTGEAISPAQVHPDHVFWAMPRRIRLDVDDVHAGECDVCGRHSNTLIRQFIAKNYGLNYKGAWDHPLSPYYEAKGDWLPLHPQPGGLGYRHWLAWLLGADDTKSRQRPSRVVTHALNERKRQMGGALRLWAFGYDMDNMKARCWYDSSLPLYGLDECEADALRTVSSCVSSWLSGAQSAATSLRGAVKDAWFGGDARGDFSSVDAEFWGRTEASFYQLLRQSLEALRADPLADVDELAVRQTWHAALVRTALDLFDHAFVGTGPIERQKPHRIAEARRKLLNNLYGNKMREALRLPSPERLSKKGTPGASAQA